MEKRRSFFITMRRKNIPFLHTAVCPDTAHNNKKIKGDKNMQEIQFEFFRGTEAEQYTFYRIPKALFTAECFRELSCEARVLYGLLLDRMSLSIRNRWIDKEGRVYIIFTVEEIAEQINCGTQKAVRLLKELDGENGIGLIEKKRLGFGKPNIIYVKNFLVKSVENIEANKEIDNPLSEINEEDERLIQEKEQALPDELQNSENHNSGDVEEIQKNHGNFVEKSLQKQDQNDEIHHSRMVKNNNQEYRKSQSNNTDINNTDRNNIYPILSVPTSTSAGPYKKTDKMDMMAAYRKRIQEQISYWCFQKGEKYRLEEVNELVELMVEVMLMPDESSIQIARMKKPVSVVKNRFMKLDQMHIEYVLRCLEKNTGKVGNIKAYLLTALYNAPLTINNYYTAEVNHDLYGK